jgi:hypothetical protein
VLIRLIYLFMVRVFGWLVLLAPVCVARDGQAAGDLLARHIQRTSDSLRGAATGETGLAA